MINEEEEEDTLSILSVEGRNIVKDGAFGSKSKEQKPTKDLTINTISLTIVPTICLVICNQFCVIVDIEFRF